MFRLWVSRHRVLVCLFAGVAILHGSASTAQTWREVDSPHFRVITDGSQRDGRDVAKEFEQMRSVFAAQFNKAALETGAPLVVFAVREPSLNALAPSLWKDRDRVAGEFFKGWERQYAMVRLDSFGDLNQAVVFHEYAHSVLHANVHWLPMWLDEGMAEFYAYTRFQGDHIYVGAPSVRFAHLRGETATPAKEMMAANGKTLGNDVRRNDLFYGEAWAMVHYMMFGPDMGNGHKLNLFISSLEKGTSQAQAFEEVFGDTKTFDKKLELYLSKFTLTAGLLPPAAGVDAKAFPTKILTASEASYEIGSFDIGVGDEVTARKRLEAAEAANSSLAGPHEEIGFLAWREGRDDEAKAEWKKAVAADPGMYRSAFALLMSGSPLKEQSERQLETTRLALEEIKGKAPKYAPVPVELALIDWRMGHMNKAYQEAMEAQSLEPWRAEYRLLAGYILLQGHQPKVAEEYARMVAARWTGPDHDEAVDLWNQIPASARSDGPALKLAIPVEVTVARGTILSSSCDKSGVSLSFQANTPNAPVLKLVAAEPFDNGFSDTLWVGEDHYTPCFHLGGLPAVVGYEAAGDGRAKLRVLEVRDDLPKLSLPEVTPVASGGAKDKP